MELTDGLPISLKLDLSPLNLKPGSEIVLFSDGVNAHRNANDYRRTEVSFDSAEPLFVNLSEGGGFAAKISAK